MWFKIAECMCACGRYPAMPFKGGCGECGQRPVPVGGPHEFYIPSTLRAVERGSRVQLVLKVRGGAVAA